MGGIAPADVQTLCATFSVTVIAARRNLGAANPGIRRVVGPLDFRIRAHRQLFSNGRSAVSVV